MKTNKLQFLSSTKSKLILSCFVLTGIISGTIYSYLQDAVYESSVTFNVPKAETNKVTVQLFQPTQTATTEEITSAPFISKLFTEEGGMIQSFVRYDYKTRYSHYSFPYDITFRAIDNNDFEKQDYKFISADDKTFTVETTSQGVIRIKKGTFGEELIDNNIALTITKKNRSVITPDYLVQKPEYLFTVYSPAAITNELLANASTIKATDNDGLITLKVQSKNASTATTIANTIAKSYIGKPENGTNNKSLSSTDEQINKIEAQIALTESEISKYKTANLLVNIDASADAALSLNKDLQLRQTSLELQLAALDNLTNYLRKNRSVNNSQVEYGVISDPAFSDQLSKLNAKYELKAKGNAPATTDAEIENLKLLISERILNTRKKTAVQIDKINEAIAAIDKKVSRMPEQANVLTALERKMQLDKLVYSKLIERKANFILDETVANNTSKIIKPATTPIAPVYPISWLIIVIGAFAGMLVGSIVSFITAASSKQKVQSLEELRNESRIPYIATIPTIYSNVANNAASVNNLCTSVLMMPETKIITFASANKGDGKTFVSTKLAQSLAALDKKVIVLDMNHDSPSVANSFDVSPESTLTEVLNGNCDIHDAICLTSFPNIEVLSPGELPSGINSFLSSTKKETIIDTLRKHYDYIIIDTPVTEDNSGAIAMMKMSDLNLFIVKANTTRKSSLVNAEKLLNDFNIKSLYLILNTSSQSNTNQKNTPNRKTTGRKINVQRKSIKENEQPKSFLKRIALWFY